LNGNFFIDLYQYFGEKGRKRFKTWLTATENLPALPYKKHALCWHGFSKPCIKLRFGFPREIYYHITAQNQISIACNVSLKGSCCYR